MAVLLTAGVYAAEDLFQKLPIHWMWWPAIGGLFVGLGGLIFPPALGVGYDVIGLLLKGNVAFQFLLGVLLVKSIIWIISLGSGTSGGVVAPLLMMGAALGGMETLLAPHVFPVNYGPGFWELLSMGAILAGTMRSPFTGIVFSMELTHDWNMLVPLMLACFISHGTMVLLLKRSILTEKIWRRGYHLSREYALDPLEILMVREVMRTNIVALPDETTLEEARELIRPAKRHGQHLFPLIDSERHVLGVFSRNQLLADDSDASKRLSEIVSAIPEFAHPDEPLRAVVYRMADTGYTRFPVVDESTKLIGMIALHDLLQARSKNLEEERDRKRVLRLRLPFGRTEKVKTS